MVHADIDTAIVTDAEEETYVMLSAKSSQVAGCRMVSTVGFQFWSSIKTICSSCPISGLGPESAALSRKAQSPWSFTSTVLNRLHSPRRKCEVLQPELSEPSQNRVRGQHTVRSLLRSLLAGSEGEGMLQA